MAVPEESDTSARVALRTAVGLVAGCLATLVLSLALLACPPRWRSQRFSDRVLYVWSRCWLVGVGARVKVHGREHLDRGGTCVVVSNHQSNLDAIVYVALSHGSLRILAKRELFDVPLLGAALNALGMVKVDRNTPDSATIRSDSARALAQGVPLLVFPEGTTSRTGEFLPFRHGAFQVAVASQVPLLPACVLDTRKVWPAKRLLVRSGTVHVVLAEPVTTTGLDHTHVAALQGWVRNRIETMYHSHQNPDEPSLPGAARTRESEDV